MKEKKGSMTKTNMLEEVARFHKEWVRTINALGENTYAEDIVQEMYLKIHKYTNPETIFNKKGELRKGYIFFVLKTILHDYRKAKAKINKVGLEALYNVSEDEDTYTEEFQEFCIKLDKEVKNWHWYDRDLFTLYKSEYKRELSLRKIAKGTGISWVSIHNTIKICKDKVRDNLRDDWDELNINN